MTCPTLGVVRCLWVRESGPRFLTSSVKVKGRQTVSVTEIFVAYKTSKSRPGVEVLGAPRKKVYGKERWGEFDNGFQYSVVRIVCLLRRHTRSMTATGMCSSGRAAGT
ncbi:hypothetical protein Ssi02_55770 [Sinosporangium siamense]|uniref:Uncharacterized protein n=1 Tax=Sinosporangium siamense TaxID=1367973 RepID=A0A919RK61_9ACTN|nr:hypothetical protein Ssi02_55770 [Sinosporangium siamense]